MENENGDLNKSAQEIESPEERTLEIVRAVKRKSTVRGIWGENKRKRGQEKIPKKLQGRT